MSIIILILPLNIDWARYANDETWNEFFRGEVDLQERNK